MPSKKKSPAYWREKADILRITFTRPTIRIREAMEALGYSSTSAVEYALKEMQKHGFVEWKPREGYKYGDWFLK